MSKGYFRNDEVNRLTFLQTHAIFQKKKIPPGMDARGVRHPRYHSPCKKGRDLLGFPSTGLSPESKFQTP